MKTKSNDKTIENETDRERQARIYPIILSEYNTAWPQWLSEEKTILKQLVGSENIVRISHIGSTAVSGLIAKPTVDILLEIKENTDLTLITDRLQNNGYIVNTPPNDIIMYIKGYGEKGFEGQVFHINVRNIGDYNELYFRDYLRIHPEVAKEYGELKTILKERFEHDRDGYTAAKGEFINKITAIARNEFKDKYKLK